MLELKGVTKETGRCFNSFIANTSGKWRPNPPPPPKKKKWKKLQKKTTRRPGSSVPEPPSDYLQGRHEGGGGQVGFSPGTAALDLIFVSRTIKICLRII